MKTRAKIELLAKGSEKISESIDRAPPEVPPGDENLTAWDENPETKGHEVPKILPEDENILADMTEEGVEEAERELRREARKHR